MVPIQFGLQSDLFVQCSFGPPIGVALLVHTKPMRGLDLLLPAFPVQMLGVRCKFRSSNLSCFVGSYKTLDHETKGWVESNGLLQQVL